MFFSRFAIQSRILRQRFCGQAVPRNARVASHVKLFDARYPRPPRVPVETGSIRHLHILVGFFVAIILRRTGENFETSPADNEAKGRYRSEGSLRSSPFRITLPRLPTALGEARQQPLMVLTALHHFNSSITSFGISTRAVLGRRGRPRTNRFLSGSPFPLIRRTKVFQVRKPVSSTF